MKKYVKPQAKLLSAKQTLLTVSDPADVGLKGPIPGFEPGLDQLGKENKNSLWD